MPAVEQGLIEPRLPFWTLTSRSTSLTVGHHVTAFS